MSATGLCPGCGAEIVFRVDTSVVAVCSFCKSVVARGGQSLEDLGKTNDVLTTGTALKLGLQGTFRGHKYEIVGRSHIAHALGGGWDEWYAAFDNGTWGWIAEHQVRFALTFENDLSGAPRVTAPSAAEPGQRFVTKHGVLVVAERGVATVVAEEGELPWRASPGERRAYLDLSGPNGVFATLDFGAVDAHGNPDGDRSFYLGREVSLSELGLGAAVVEAPVLRRQEGSRKIACPRCQAPLELKTAEALSVGCPSCGSVLSVAENGELEFLFANIRKFPPKIPLGRKVTLDADFLQLARPEDKKPLAVEVVGFVVRSVEFDGQLYYFSETLLYNEKEGFFWLVESDGHWSFVKNVPAADVAQTTRAGARHKGDLFKLYQTSTPVVEHVAGELYWRVRQGEKSRMADFIRPPFMLSREDTENEVNWTLGAYVEKADVERVFGVKLPAPTGVGANQPSPMRVVLRNGPLAALAAVALCALVAAVIPSHRVLDQRLDLAAFPASTATDPGRTFSIAPLRLRGSENVVVDLWNDSGGWLWTDASFYNQRTGRVLPFSVTVDNPPRERTRLSALPGGDYALNLKMSRSRFVTAGSARIAVYQGKPGHGWLTLMVWLLGGAYLLAVLRHTSFEKKRNENSNAWESS